MAQCDFCGKETRTLSTFTCSYCDKTFCPEHRLPFNHNCVHIEAWKQTPLQDQRAPKRKARTPISVQPGETFSVRDQNGNLFPWFIGVSAFVLILLGIGIGVYVL